MQDAKREESCTSADQAEHLRLANILDQMPVGIGVFDSNGHLFHANRHFARAAGGPISNIHMMRGPGWRPAPCNEMPHSDAAYPASRALLGEVATPGMNFIRETEDGRDHWVAVSAVPLTAPASSTLVGVVVVVEEAEERRRIAERLRAREIRFRRFAQFSSNALWIANLETGEIEFLSPLAAKIWSHGEDIGTLGAWSHCVHPDDLERASHCRHLAADGMVQRFNYRIVGQQGDVVRHVRETCFLIPSDDGEADCIGGIVEDVSPEMQVYLVQPYVQTSDLLAELRQSALRFKVFSSQQELMNVAEVLNPGCIVVDLRRQDFDTTELHAVLANRPTDLQVVFIGSRDTPTAHAVEATRAGAADYLIEPLREGALGAAIQRACEALPPRHDPLASAQAKTADRLAGLPRREREVLQGLVEGGTNKTIARKLGISPRTVEVHRAHLMERLNAANLSELLKIALQAGLAAQKPV